MRINQNCIETKSKGCCPAQLKHGQLSNSNTTLLSTRSNVKNSSRRSNKRHPITFQKTRFLHHLESSLFITDTPDLTINKSKQKPNRIPVQYVKSSHVAHRLAERSRQGVLSRIEMSWQSCEGMSAGPCLTTTSGTVPPF